MMRLIVIVLVFLALCAACTEGARDSKIIPVEDFFIKPDRSNFSISPDGRRIAYIGLESHCRNIFILDLDKPDSSKQLTHEDNMNVQYFFWINSDSLVYSNSHSPLDSLRLFAIDIFSEKATYLIPPAKHKLHWVSTPRDKGGSLLAVMNARDSVVFDLYRIRLDGSGAELIDQNPGNFTSWFASGDGQVRLAMSSDSVEDILWYREEEGLPYRSVLEADHSSSVTPMGPVKNKPHHFYALSNIGRDKMAIVELDMHTGTETLLYENKSADMHKEGYLYDTEELLYSAATVNKKKTEVHNEKLKAMFEKLKREFKGDNIDIIDVDTIMRTLIFKVYTDVNPGGIYYYDSKRDKIDELSIMNPMLAKRQMSSMEEVSFNSRDGKVIKGYITYPAKEQSKYPVVVLVHDGPNRRDVWGFNSEVQFLANRGYAVFQINYRGSTGFGKEFFAAGHKQWGGEIQNDINDGVAWLIHQGIADKDRIAIMGTGFGGYSALYAACFNSTMYKCAISASGYTNLFTYMKEIPTYYQRYLHLYYHILGNPNKDYQLFKAISPVFHADRVRMPILMLYGGKDKYNNLTDVNQFIQKVKNNNVPVRYIYKENEGRRFKEDENIIESYQEIEKFLADHLN